MKKALFICSSPRKNSNTNKIVDMVIDIFKEKSIESFKVDVANLKYKTNGCIDCGACQKIEKYECSIKDEATPILELIPQVDYLIFATPIYFIGGKRPVEIAFGPNAIFVQIQRIGPYFLYRPFKNRPNLYGRRRFGFGP